jgi:uncharacterized membrane protein YukC
METTAYLWLGLGAVTLIMGALIASFYVRYLNLKRDERLIEELEGDDR